MSQKLWVLEYQPGEHDEPAFWSIVDPRTAFTIADVYTTTKDAYLLIAAPELLAALKLISQQAVDRTREFAAFTEFAQETARVAIRTATEIMECHKEP